ncbi:MAG TPA: retroviral-like aspartic protease family protein [Sphingomicrobium sp.]|nr:retroviral-like aspartic protease family protein [Sphingomicrobium sp.]
MAKPRRALMLAFGLLLSSPAVASDTAAEPPKISKPQPAPNTPPDVPPLPPAYFDPTLAVGGDDLKARKVETRLSVAVQVNGRGPYQFIVDSGADTSAVGLRIARDLELPLGRPAILNGMTSRNLVDRVKIAQLTLGPTTVHDLEVPALREIDLGGDGLLGIDALVRQRLMMDFEKRLIKVEDAAKPMKFSPNDIVITARRQRGQLILTAVQAAGMRLDAVIDTGTEISIGNLALRDKLLRRRAKFTTVEAIGVTGVTAKLQISSIDELRLGPVVLRNVPIAFADVPPFKLFGLANEPALLLGTDILETFRRVSLDFRARKVRFQLRRCTTEGVVISTAPEHFTRLSSTGTADVCQH